jgi:hypothetical protein
VAIDRRLFLAGGGGLLSPVGALELSRHHVSRSMVADHATAGVSEWQDRLGVRLQLYDDPACGVAGWSSG